MSPMATTRLYRPDPARVAADERWYRAEASASVTAHSVVISVRGEIDASNGTALAGYVERHLGLGRTLVLDLSAVTFFGTAGLTALRRIDLCCNQIRWTFIASPAVRRVLRVCRADDLPRTESVARATRRLTPVPTG